MTIRGILVAMCAVLGAVLTAAGPERPDDIEAGTALRMDLEELVERAELVVEARVLSATPVLDPSGRVDTDYMLSVDRTFVGDDVLFRTVRLPGGSSRDGRATIVPGISGLAVGEDVVLLLTGESASGLSMPVGLDQGKYRIVTRLDGSRTAVRGAGSLALVNSANGVVLEDRGGAAFDYAELTARLESAAAAKRARAGDAGRAAKTEGK